MTGIAAVLAPWAAAGLIPVQIGAIITYLRRGEAKVLPANVALFALAVAAAWLGFLVRA